MGEMKSAIFSIALFVGVLFPALLMIGVDSLHNHGFMKVSTEVAELVKEEGGVTSKVSRVVDSLKGKGYKITFKDSDGKVVSGKRTFGDTIYITYDYTYQSIKKERHLKTQNIVHVMKR
ncbi:hypothetical protein [Bacillus badius]|uniref:DUF4845 domain-containing protein n=1 Tax=Bacillus badius TaxID=1455 RepID=A0ABR5AQR4_BACBA|nr:hypothetical protein [Bacillus badius]KIL73852.1 hypothetical protein SD78_2910 [Bacillus badius]KIL77090.1 hypothetical protein SD77_1842 [Bacillus badius]KZO00920.1 hypothetical protein A4244_14485 [Bacillus badius]MED0668056.1 hypothetical protein [Bacillus badius]MED4717835.1 hypothetical protein [Bacillus badius]